MLSKTAISIGFQSWIFKITKYIVIFLTVLSLLGVAWSGIKLATTFGSKFETPVYSGVAVNAKRDTSSRVNSSAEGKLALNTKHGADILALLGKSNLNKDMYYDQIVASMLRLPVDLQGKYVSSADQWLDASVKAGNKAEQAIVEFDSSFHQAVTESNHLEQSAELERARWIALASGGATFCACLIIILVLLQIEVNTRVTAENMLRANLPAAAVSEPFTKTVKNVPVPPAPVVKAPEPVKALICPKCSSAVSQADIFCGGCGHKLK